MRAILLLLWFRLCLRYTSRHNTPPTAIPTSNIMRHIATNTPLFMRSSLSDNLSAKKHTDKTQLVVLIMSNFSHIFIGSYNQLKGRFIDDVNTGLDTTYSTY